MGFNLGPEKILVVLVFALVLLGPDKLPEVARKLGEWLGTARRMSGGFQNELRQVLDEPMKTFQRELSLGEHGASSPPTTHQAEPAAPADQAAGSGGAVAAPTPASTGPEPVGVAGDGDAEEVGDAQAADAPAAPAARARSAPASPIPSWVFPSASSEADRPGFH